MFRWYINTMLARSSGEGEPENTTITNMRVGEVNFRLVPVRVAGFDSAVKLKLIMRWLFFDFLFRQYLAAIRRLADHKLQAFPFSPAGVQLEALGSIDNTRE